MKKTFKELYFILIILLGGLQGIKKYALEAISKGFGKNLWG